MKSIESLLKNNRAWASGMLAQDPKFFKRLSQIQRPKYLWIGCSDSRVPANEIVGLLPGELFVHRNVGNVVVHTDLNCLSVIQFAVDVLKIQDIIVCGHYGCGGVKAAYAKTSLGLIDNWLRHIQDVAHEYKNQLKGLPLSQRYDKLCELNVLAQVGHVAQATVVQDAWRKGRKVAVHGLIYGLKDGRLRDLKISLTRPPAVI